ncbi:lytic murein transglycosylase B, partial [Solemya velum gill symbiont]
RVEREYQVPAHVIVGIIGVETRWGRITGDYVVLDTLSTIAFDYPRRSAYFTKELEEFLLMSREEGVDPRTPRGSYAGAMGLGQFMPSSFRKYAVDYSRDGVRDLMNPKDAIASVANYFKAHGWKPGEDVAVRANKSGSAYRKVKWGYSSNYTLRELSRVGVKPRKKIKTNEVSLLRFANYKSDEVWLGLNNFYVITRYNRSSKYAMAVYQLGEQLNKRVRPAKSASRESLLVLGES